MNTVRQENELTGGNTGKEVRKENGKEPFLFSYMTFALENPKVSSKTVLDLIGKLSNVAGYREI